MFGSTNKILVVQALHELSSTTHKLASFIQLF